MLRIPEINMKTKTPKKIIKPKPEVPEVAPDREFTQQLRVDLTDHELTEKAREQARKQNTLDQEEIDKKRASSEFANRIKAIKADLSRLAYTVDTGYELREVQCVQFFDRPEKGKKSTIRIDTKEVVSVEDMSPADRQMSLPIEESTNGNGDSTE
jgi:hypothetical protein